MDRLLNYLSDHALVIADGAWGTMLQEAGLPAGECPEAYNLTHPERVSRVAMEYLAAGSEIIITNSFGGNPWRLAGCGLHECLQEINRRGAEICRTASDGRHLVMAVMGPSGRFLEPLGDLTAADMRAGYSAQAEALAAGGADAILVETMSDLSEACIAAESAAATGLPVACTMTFEHTPRGFRTMMGADIPGAAVALTAAGAAILGANCGSALPAQMVEIVQAFRAHTPLPLLVRMNAGTPTLVDGRPVYPLSPGSMAAFVPELARAGAAIIGGCCGTTPEHIRKMVEAKNSLVDLPAG